MNTAVGIPDMQQSSDPSLLAEGLSPYVLKKHEADRAGLHHDLRLADSKGRLHSWALPEGMPKPGEKRLAVLQPLHDWKDYSFQGVIPQGEYGGGLVRIADKGEALITHASPEKVNFITASRKKPEAFTLIRTKDKNWLLLNTTADFYVKGLLEANPKPSYSSINPDDFKGLPAGAELSAKIDGARVLVHMLKNKARVYSHRLAKDGTPIEHTHRIGGLLNLDVPKDLRNTLYAGELYGLHNNRAIPPQELGGILNSTLANAIRTKQARDIALKVALFKSLGKAPPKSAIPASST
jgi:hypothetical protein